MRETKVSKLSLLSEVGSLIYDFRLEKKNSSIDRMRAVTSESYNTHTFAPFRKWY